MKAIEMARAGAYYTYQDGQLITLRDLLEREININDKEKSISMIKRNQYQ